MKDQGFFKQLVSGANGIISSKRVMGMLVLVVCLICIIYLVVSEGGSGVVENLLQTAMVMAASLLGISSVTSIWKGNQVSMGDNSKGSSESHIEPQQPEQPQINVTVECPLKKDGCCNQ
jgi:cytosine/uracil/thiamine/allantoin permease